MSNWNRRPLIHCLTIAQFLALLLYGITASPAAAPPVTHVRGVVLDEAGKPLAGAPVGIQAHGALAAVRKQYPQLSLRTTADAQGRYDLVVPRALGRVHVVSRLPGRVAAGSGLVTLDAAQLDLPPLRMSRGLSLQGIVLDAERRPIAGASIFASVPHQARHDTLGGPAHRMQVRSGNDGRFMLQGFNAIEYVLRAEARGYSSWGGSYFNVTSQKGPLEIVLGEPAAVSGVVSDVEGKPLAGATLTQFDADPYLSTTTDARGRFRLGPMRTGPLHIIDITLAGYTPLQARADPPESDIKLVMLRNGTLRGRVLDADTRAPLPSFSIRFVPRDRQLGDMRDAVPNPRSLSTQDGRFSLPDMYAGTWAAVVTAPGHALTYVPIEVAAGQSTPEILFELSRGHTLRGRVIDQATGKPLAGAELRFSPDRPSRVYSYEPMLAYSTFDGSFSFPNLPSGEIGIEAGVEDYLGTRCKVDTRQRPFVTFALGRGSTISGQILASDGVTPLSGEVKLASSPPSGVTYGVGTDAQGRFLIENQHPGRYLLSASNAKARSGSQEIVLAGDRPVTGIRLVLQQLPSIRGAVTGLPTEQPRARLSATTVREDVRMALLAFPGVSGTRTSSDAQGTYRLEGLDPGPTWVIAQSEQQRIAKRVVVPESGEASLDFDFGREARISGRVMRGGRPAANLSIRATPVDEQGITAVAATSKTGEYAFTDLGRGSYTLHLAPLEPVRVDVDRPLVRDFVLAPHDLAGRLIDAATKQPLTMARIQLHDNNGKTRDAYADLRGHFNITALEAGEYTLTAHSRGYDVMQQRIALVDSVSDVNLSLHATEGISLRLRSQQDVDSIAVSILSPANGLPAGELWLGKEANGSFKLPPALVARTFKITTKEHAPLTISNWNGAPLEVELQRVAAE